MSRGFTLVEVLVALIVLEVSVVGVFGTLALASATLTRAEILERAVARTEGVLDSLRRGSEPGRGERSFGSGDVLWTVEENGVVELRAVADGGTVLLTVRSQVPPR